MSILSWIVVGLIAGGMGGLVSKGGGFDMIGDIIVGVIGGLLGGWMAFSLFHIGAGVDGINLVSIFVAFVVAVVLIFIVRMIGGRRRLITSKNFLSIK